MVEREGSTHADWVSKAQRFDTNRTAGALRNRWDKIKMDPGKVGRSTELEREEEVEIEKIITSRYNKHRKRTEYRIRWRGFDQRDDTWEPVENLGNAAALIEGYTREHHVYNNKQKEEDEQGRGWSRKSRPPSRSGGWARA